MTCKECEYIKHQTAPDGKWDSNKGKLGESLWVVIIVGCLMGIIGLVSFLVAY